MHRNKAPPQAFRIDVPNRIMIYFVLLALLLSKATGFQPLSAHLVPTSAPSCCRYDAFRRAVSLSAIKEKKPTQETGSKEDSSLLKSLRKKLTFPISATSSQSSSSEPSVIQRVKKKVKTPFQYLKNLFRKSSPEEEDDDDDDFVIDAESVMKSATDAFESFVKEVPAQLEEATNSIASFAEDLVKGDRRATSASKVDLSGNWEVIVTEEFKQQYDRYLTLLGQPMLVRSVALSIVGLTTEETKQKNSGKELFIRGRNVRGVWERTLVSSTSDDPVLKPIVSADDEKVQAEAWWEKGGTVHRSWLRGVQKYGGGAFESKRYLEDNGKVLVCESTFHPNDEAREKASMTWRFKRV